MKWSDGEVAETPPRVTTVTLTVPLPDGETALTVVSETGTTPVAGFDPNCTLLTPVRNVPEIVTAVPPACGPDEGLIPLTTGALTYV